MTPETDKALVEDYHDMDGNPCTLEKLTRTEPAWACNAIRQLKSRGLESQARIEALEAGERVWQSNNRDLWAALNLIRQEVEEHGPVKAGEHLPDPTPQTEAQAIVEAISARNGILEKEVTRLHSGLQIIAECSDQEKYDSDHDTDTGNADDAYDMGENNAYGICARMAKALLGKEG